MKKKIILTFLGIAMFAPLIYASHLGTKDTRRVYVGNGHHMMRPHRRVILNRPHWRHNHVRLIHRVGHRIPNLHRRAIHVNAGGLGYRYQSGAFYRPYRSGFRVVHAPIGAVIHRLPVGYMNVRMNNNNYYRYEDTYYKPCQMGYKVVETPTQYNRYPTQNYQYQIGDIAHNLPVGAMEVIIDGKRYYEAEGRYFLKIYKDGRDAYEVVNI